MVLTSNLINVVSAEKGVTSAPTKRSTWKWTSKNVIFAAHIQRGTQKNLLGTSFICSKWGLLKYFSWLRENDTSWHANWKLIRYPRKYFLGNGDDFFRDAKLTTIICWQEVKTFRISLGSKGSEFNRSWGLQLVKIANHC